MHRHLLCAVLALAGLLAMGLLMAVPPAAARGPADHSAAAAVGSSVEPTGTPVPPEGNGASARGALAAATPVSAGGKTAPPAKTPPPAPSKSGGLELPASGPLCPSFANYLVYTNAGASLVPGTADTGNHCDDCLTTISLPFAFTLYDTAFTSAQVSSNGQLDFGTGDANYFNSCLPDAAATYAIFPYWDDLYTADAGGGQGIFTSVSGAAPNRVFNVEWRAVPCCTAGAPTLDFEVRLYEGQRRFDLVYGNLSGNTGSGATFGVQQASSGASFTQFSCNSASLAPGLQEIYLLPTCSACASGDYGVSSSTGASIVPGSTRIDGSGCNDCIFPLSLPFAYTLYDQTYNSVTVSTNGNLQFASNNLSASNLCLPGGTPFNYAILPYWDDLATVNTAACPGGVCGIYTSVSGSAPNRVFNVEWRAVDLATGSGYVNFEVRLYEGSTYFELVYGTVSGSGSSATVGVQHGLGDHYTQFACNTVALAAGMRLGFNLACPPPTPTPTITPTVTPTPTNTPTPVPVPCGTNVVASPGFETGAFSPWVVADMGPAPFIASTATGYPAHSGTYSAHVGFLPGYETGGDSSFYQTVAVPPSGGTLSYWYWPRTTDSISWDWQDAYVQDTNGNTLATIMHVCSNTQTWTPVTFDMSRYAGQMVRIKFLAHGDAAGDSTDMFVDDVQLLTPPCPTATRTATRTPTATPTCSPDGNYRILVVYGDPPNPPTRFLVELATQPGVSDVESFDITWSTPTLAQLQQYQIVVPYVYGCPADPTAFGNVLADYVDRGGIVVGLSFLWGGSTCWGAGRYNTTYAPYISPAYVFTNTNTLGWYNPAHPLMQGVSTLTAEMGSYDRLGAAAQLVASWSTGQPLIATQTVNGHTSVGITAYLGTYESHSGDFARVIVNAGRWLDPPPCGPTPTSTPTLTPTPTATPTNTPAMMPTDTPTATNTTVMMPMSAPATAPVKGLPPGGQEPALCAVRFGDVPPGDPLYAAVEYLACRGVIGGYADSTFRPDAGTTRAQTIKLAVLGFARALATPPDGAYTFADVPPGSPVFAVVETAVARRIIAGYPCGGPGEPCDSRNRPYFRPAAAVSRGQVAKIMVLAAGGGLINPPTPTFADVLPGSAFYQFVETAACHRLISGYACGGPGEPCLPPGPGSAPRPYFRPDIGATRGQIATIVDRSIGNRSSCAGPAGPR